MGKSTLSKTIIGFLIVLVLAQYLFCCGCGSQSVVVTRKGNCNLEILSTEPKSPATLQAGEKVNVTFKYDMGEYKSVQIWARPRTNGADTKGYRAHGSAVYNKYDGAKDEIQGYFSFDEPTVVDEIVVRMKDKTGDKYVCVAKKQVNFEWKGSTSVKASLRDDAWDKELLALANKTKGELKDSKKHDNEGALIYRVHSENGPLSQSRTEFHWTGNRRGGYRPDRISEGQTKVMFEKNGQSAELRVIHPDYHEFRRPVVFEKGIVTVWDDIVLERVSPENSCTVKGTVHLEDNADAKDIRVSSDDTSTTTDENGNFTLTGLRSGEIRIGARKTGYHGLYTNVEVARGQTASCKLEGYRTRRAKVRWAYQPDSSKEIEKDNMVIGTAVLRLNELDRVSFAAGFKQARRENDFYVRQRKDELAISTSCGRNGPAIHETDRNFEDVNEIPNFVNGCRSFTLGAGKVYVFRCYDGQHYAKMEILEIID